MRGTIFIFLASVVALSSCSQRLPEHDVEFGLVRGNDQIVPVPGNQLPFRVGLVYGWRLNLHEPVDELRLNTVFTLPSPAQWDFEDQEGVDPTSGQGQSVESVRINASGQVFRNEITISTEEPSYQLGDYEMIARDPKGPHKLEIFLNGTLIETIEFAIIDKPHV